METKWKVLVLLVVVTLVQGCATQLAVSERTDAPTLRFQTNAVADAAAIDAEALKPGDILLSADPTLPSASIRLMTLSPVSHAALYIGHGRVVEALSGGVRVRSLDELLDEAALVLVLRHPELTAEQAGQVVDYAVGKSGAGFSFVGMTLQLPFTISRRACELPLVSSTLRDVCLRGIAVLPKLAAQETRFFCSQLVLQAYRHGGLQLTGADPRRISPADILHMREGDVSSVVASTRLLHVGNLKTYDRAPTTLALQQ